MKVIYRIEVFQEEYGRYAAKFKSGDRRIGGMGQYSATPIGALAELCSTLIKVEEDISIERRVPVTVTRESCAECARIARGVTWSGSPPKCQKHRQKIGHPKRRSGQG